MFQVCLEGNTTPKLCVFFFLFCSMAALGQQNNKIWKVNQLRNQLSHWQKETQTFFSYRTFFSVSHSFSSNANTEYTVWIMMIVIFLLFFLHKSNYIFYSSAWTSISRSKQMHDKFKWMPVGVYGCSFLFLANDHFLIDIKKKNLENRQQQLWTVK